MEDRQYQIVLANQNKPEKVEVRRISRTSSLLKALVGFAAALLISIWLPAQSALAQADGTLDVPAEMGGEVLLEGGMTTLAEYFPLLVVAVTAVAIVGGLIRFIWKAPRKVSG